MKLVLVHDELGYGVEVDETTIKLADAQNKILTELASQKHDLSDRDWHDIAAILVRSDRWEEGVAKYDSPYYREEYKYKFGT